MKHTEYIIPIGEEAKDFDEIFIGVLRKHKELIRCKDCHFRDSELACTQFDAYTSAAGDLFMPPDWFYCGYGKRKEE